MTRPEVWPPPPDRKQRDIHDAGEVVHPREEVGVTGEIPAHRAVDAVPERSARRTERTPAAVVLGVERDHTKLPDLDLVTGTHLEHLPSLRRLPAETRIREPAGLGVLLRRTGHEVIEVRAGDQLEVGQDRRVAEEAQE